MYALLVIGLFIWAMVDAGTISSVLLVLPIAGFLGLGLNAFSTLVNIWFERVELRAMLAEHNAPAPSWAWLPSVVAAVLGAGGAVLAASVAAWLAAD